MVRIVVSKIARKDIKEVVDYIKRGSVKYAFLEKQYIEDAINKLKFQPQKGKIFLDASPNVRELVFRNYRIVYEIVSDDRIDILTIHHHARSLGNNPAFKDED